MQIDAHANPKSRLTMGDCICESKPFRLVCFIRTSTHETKDVRFCHCHILRGKRRSLRSRAKCHGIPARIRLSSTHERCGHNIPWCLLLSRCCCVWARVLCEIDLHPVLNTNQGFWKDAILRCTTRSSKSLWKKHEHADQQNVYIPGVINFDEN